jgi:hypothetical protein
MSEEARDASPRRQRSVWAVTSGIGNEQTLDRIYSTRDAAKAWVEARIAESAPRKKTWEQRTPGHWMRGGAYFHIEEQHVHD